MKTPTVTSSTDSQMHNNIMAAVQAVAATDDSLVVPEHTIFETPMNMSPTNKAHVELEKVAIHLILTGIRDEIYSTVDACQTAQEMWEAIKRLQQGESLNIQDMTMNVAGARENVGSLVVQQFRIQCFNCKEFGHFAKECRKPKRVKDSAYHKEKMLLCKQAEKVETDDSNVIPDSPHMCDDDIHNDKNDVERDDEHIALANLIANLNLDVDENKKIQKQLKKANTTLAQELKECKTILAKTSKTLGESNSVRDSYLVALQNKQTEFQKYKAYNDCTIDYDKFVRKLNDTLGQLAQKDSEIKEGLKLKAYEISVVKEKHDELIKQSLLTKSHYEGLVKQKTKVITDLKLKEENDIEKYLSMEKQLKFFNKIDMDILIKTCLMPLSLKTQNGSFIFVHELKQEMHADLKYVESFENKIDELESDKDEFSNMYDMILQESVSNEVMCTYLLSLSDLDALAELQCLHLYKVKECDCLAQKLSNQTESVSKEVYTELLLRFPKVEM
nr:hypothetical protein [Tanacetum cinerariifolium]